VKGILVLDDIVGFVNEIIYWSSRIHIEADLRAFPGDWVKNSTTNDAEVDACLDTCGRRFHMLNWGKQRDIREVKRRVGNGCA